jgi:ABC-type thiamin/hydroxymethylpyrimidine transport system permease subunit
MLPFYSWNFVLMVVFAIFYYRAAEFEDCSGTLWAGLSIAISAVIWQWLHWGLLAMILGQVLLFIGIGVFRVIRDK